MTVISVSKWSGRDLILLMTVISVSEWSGRDLTQPILFLNLAKTIYPKSQARSGRKQGQVESTVRSKARSGRDLTIQLFFEIAEIKSIHAFLRHCK